jgi:hypothetical protein
MPPATRQRADEHAFFVWPKKWPVLGFWRAGSDSLSHQALNLPMVPPDVYYIGRISGFVLKPATVPVRRYIAPTRFLGPSSCCLSSPSSH